MFLLNEAVPGRDARIRSIAQYSDGDPRAEESAWRRGKDEEGSACESDQSFFGAYGRSAVLTRPYDSKIPLTHSAPRRCSLRPALSRPATRYNASGRTNDSSARIALSGCSLAAGRPFSPHAGEWLMYAPPIRDEYNALFSLDVHLLHPSRVRLKHRVEK